MATKVIDEMRVLVADEVYVASRLIKSGKYISQARIDAGETPEPSVFGLVYCPFANESGVVCSTSCAALKPTGLGKMGPNATCECMRLPSPHERFVLFEPSRIKNSFGAASVPVGDAKDVSANAKATGAKSARMGDSMFVAVDGGRS